MSRLHQMPISVSDMNNFISEGDLYLSTIIISYSLSGMWEKEVERKMWRIYNDPTYLTTKIFGSNFVTNNPMTDTFGNLLVDDVGNMITD